MPGNKIFVDLPSASVTNGGTATFDVPIGKTLHNISLNCTNCTLAEITDIRLVANGKTIQRYDTGTILDEFNQVDGLATAGAGDFANPLFIHFDSMSMRTIQGEEMTAIGTGNPKDPNPISTLKLEVDIASGATGVTMTAQAEMSGPSDSGLVKIQRIFNYNPAGAGVFEISDLPKGDLIRRIWFYSAIVTAVEIERDGFTLFDRTKVVNNAKLILDGYRAAPSTGYLIDFGEKGDPQAALATLGAKDLRFKCTVSGAGALPVYVEYVGPIGR